MRFVIVFSVLYSLAVSVGACRNCTNNDFIQIQLNCADSIHKFVKAKDHFSFRNRQNFCRYLYELYFCIGENVPICLHTLTGYYKQYYFTPWDCHPDQNVTMKLQLYIIKATNCSRNGSHRPKQSTKLVDSNMKYNIIKEYPSCVLMANTSPITVSPYTRTILGFVFLLVTRGIVRL